MGKVERTTLSDFCSDMFCILRDVHNDNLLDYSVLSAPDALAAACSGARSSEPVRSDSASSVFAFLLLIFLVSISCKYWRNL